jgi:hypothetical protein
MELKPRGRIVLKPQMDWLKYIATLDDERAEGYRLSVIRQYPWAAETLARIASGKANDKEVRAAVMRMRDERPPKKLRDFLT